MDTSTPLVPESRIGLRVAILVFSIAFALIGTTPWHSKLGFCLTMAGILGTFPRPRISTTCFEKQWFVIFVPVYLQRTQLTDVIQIEISTEERWLSGCVLARISHHPYRKGRPFVA